MLREKAKLSKQQHSNDYETDVEKGIEFLMIVKTGNAKRVIVPQFAPQFSRL